MKRIGERKAGGGIQGGLSPEVSPIFDLAQNAHETKAQAGKRGGGGGLAERKKKEKYGGAMTPSDKGKGTSRWNGFTEGAP